MEIDHSLSHFRYVHRRETIMKPKSLIVINSRRRTVAADKHKLVTALKSKFHQLRNAAITCLFVDSCVLVTRVTAQLPLRQQNELHRYVRCFCVQKSNDDVERKTAAMGS